MSQKIIIILIGSLLLQCNRGYSYSSVNHSNDNLVSTHSTPVREIEKIVLFRHGEKPLFGKGQLTCCGLNRAFALTKVLTAKYGQPNYIFASKPSILYEPLPYHYVRPLATIEPTAIKFGMPVNTMYAYDQVTDFVNEVLSPKYHSSLLFVVWEHIKLNEIAKKIMSLLGGNPSKIPYWSEFDYDSLYVMNIDWHKKKVKFSIEYENLDNQSEKCPATITLGHTVTTLNNLKEDSIYIETLLFIPVAEADSDGQLNCRGLNRALALQNILNASNPNINNDIDAFIAPATSADVFHKNDTQNNYSAGIMTIEPTTINHGEPLLCPYGYLNVNKMAHYLEKVNFYNQTVAITWPTPQLRTLVEKIYTDAGKKMNDIPHMMPDANAIYKIKIIRNGNGKVKSASMIIFFGGVPLENTCNY